MITTHAAEIVVVSAERIAAELQRMLLDSSRDRAIELLWGTGLLECVLPESSRWRDAPHTQAHDSAGVDVALIWVAATHRRNAFSLRLEAVC